MFKNILTVFFCLLCYDYVSTHFHRAFFPLFSIRNSKISIGNLVLFTITIWVCYLYSSLCCCCYCCFGLLLFIPLCIFFLLFSLCSFLLRVFSGRKQKQSYVHNNLRFSLCLRCYLHVQTTAFSGENMHENRKESLLCIFFLLSFFLNLFLFVVSCCECRVRCALCARGRAFLINVQRAMCIVCSATMLV